MRMIILVTCILTIAPYAAAQTPSPSLFGAGLKTCKEMGQINKEYPQFNALFNAWLQGYFSGLNFGFWAEKKVDFLRDRAPTDGISFVDGFCTANPEKTVVEAANQYMFKALDAFLPPKK